MSNLALSTAAVYELLGLRVESYVCTEGVPKAGGY